MPQSRITRIRQMEEIYDRVRTDIATLREYEESGQWLQDYEADERGELPRDLKRGVLSQDGLDDVFEDAKSLPSPPRKYPFITLCGNKINNYGTTTIPLRELQTSRTLRQESQVCNRPFLAVAH